MKTRWQPVVVAIALLVLGAIKFVRPYRAAYLLPGWAYYAVAGLEIATSCMIVCWRECLGLKLALALFCCGLVLSIVLPHGTCGCLADIEMFAGKRGHLIVSSLGACLTLAVMSDTKARCHGKPHE